MSDLLSRFGVIFFKLDCIEVGGGSHIILFYIQQYFQFYNQVFRINDLKYG